MPVPAEVGSTTELPAVARTKDGKALLAKDGCPLSTECPWLRIAHSPKMGNVDAKFGDMPAAHSWYRVESHMESRVVVRRSVESAAP